MKSLLASIVLWSMSSSIVAVAAPTLKIITIRAGQKIVASQRIPGDTTIVQIGGLEPEVAYTIVAKLNLGAQELQSSAQFNADPAGMISTETAAPISGTYTHVDPDGLFWSMSPTASAVPISAPGYRFSVRKGDSEVTSTSIPMALKNPGVIVIDLAGTGLVGKLFVPPNAKGPLPAVIAYSGSEGGVQTGEDRAAALASEGFVALGIGYFGAPGLPDQLANIQLEYFKTAINYLKSRPDVRADRIAVVGPSRGGELSLLLGSTFQEIKAVVAYVPSPYRWAGNADEDQIVPAWISNGVALPFLETVGGLVSTVLSDGQTALANRPSFLAGMQDSQKVAQAMTEVEKINGPVLMIGADDDQVWPSCLFVRNAMDRLKALRHPFQDQAICYPNAGHGIDSLPFLSTIGSNATMHPVIKKLIALGGTAQGNAFGQRDAWQKTLTFLHEALK